MLLKRSLAPKYETTKAKLPSTSTPIMSIRTMFLRHLYSIGVLIVILTAIVPLVDCHVMVTSTSTTEWPVCPGDTVTFTCITKGSLTIGWRSEEYVETGGTLVFIADRDINSTKTSPVNPNTVATLIDQTEEDGIVVLKSQLRIVASSDFPTSTVVCIHSNGSLDRFNFQLIGDPDVPEIEHNPIQTKTSSEQGAPCLISFGWKPVINVTHYMVHVDEKYRVNETANFTTLEVPGCKTHRLRLQAVNMCNRLSGDTTKDVPYYSGSELISFIESPTKDISTDTNRDSTTKSPICPCPSCDVTCIVLLIFLFILLSVIIVLVVTIVIIIRGKNKVGSCFKEKKISSHSALNIPSNERESELHSSEQKTETDT